MTVSKEAFNLSKIPLKLVQEHQHFLRLQLVTFLLIGPQLCSDEIK